jgi:hypothetical protein
LFFGSQTKWLTSWLVTGGFHQNTQWDVGQHCRRCSDSIPRHIDAAPHSHCRAKPRRWRLHHSSSSPLHSRENLELRQGKDDVLWSRSHCQHTLMLYINNISVNNTHSSIWHLSGF